MISKKMKYALKALIHIANHQDAGIVKAQDIAELAQIPKKFLEQILLDLKKGRIINSKQGNIGGYYFLKNPAETTLADVYRLIDGPIALVPCASKNYYEACTDCPNEAECSIRHALIEVRDETLKILEKRNIADLAEGSFMKTTENWTI
jgi:Rrf2 family protein